MLSSDGILRSIEKYCSFHCPESLKISTRTPTAIIRAATVVGGFSEVHSSIFVRSWTDSAKLVGILDVSRVVIILTIAPTPTLRVLVSPNQHGQGGIKYKVEIPCEPGTSLKVRASLLSIHPVPLCHLDYHRTFRNGSVALKMFTKIEKEYLIGGEFHVSQSSGFCTDLWADTTRTPRWDIGFQRSFGLANLSFVYGIHSKRFVSALEIPRWKNPYCLKIAREEGKWVGTLASFLAYNQNLIRWAVSTEGKARGKFVARPNSDIHLSLMLQGSLPKLQLGALSISVRLGHEGKSDI
jgi:hypothetical protein